jgi:hypothetical protein
VVISIIGVLASLVLGLSGLAGRKSKESRVKMELTRLTTAIENYKSALGFYPPDNRVLINVGGRPQYVGMPATNQLFYELSGTVYRNGQFHVLGRQEPLSASVIQSWFGSPGFANAARDERDVKFTEEFKASQYRRISVNPPIDVLASPVIGPANRTIQISPGVTVNPWLYVSTSPTNNPERYDLWTEVVIGGKTIRVSNWEKDPVVISP